MVRLGKLLAAAGAVVLCGTATLAHAQTTTLSTKPPITNAFADGDSGGPAAIPYPHKTYAFDNKGRWGVKLELNQPTNRDPEWKDAQVGGYFRITPNLRLGGTVGLGDKFAQPQHLTPDDTGPRVHLEGAFKF